jgi:hypothetical protein
MKMVVRSLWAAVSVVAISVFAAGCSGESSPGESPGGVEVIVLDSDGSIQSRADVPARQTQAFDESGDCSGDRWIACASACCDQHKMAVVNCSAGDQTVCYCNSKCILTEEAQ